MTTIGGEKSINNLAEDSEEASQQTVLHGPGPTCLEAALRSDQRLPCVGGLCSGSSQSRSGIQSTRICLQGTLSNGKWGVGGCGEHSGEDYKCENHSIFDIKQKTSRKLTVCEEPYRPLSDTAHLLPDLCPGSNSLFPFELFSRGL